MLAKLVVHYSLDNLVILFLFPKELFLHHLRLLSSNLLNLFLLLSLRHRLVVLVAWMLLLYFLCLKILVKDLSVAILIGFPKFWHWGHQTFFGYVKQIIIFREFKPYILSILPYFLSCRLVIFVNLFLKRHRLVQLFFAIVFIFIHEVYLVSIRRIYA